MPKLDIRSLIFCWKLGIGNLTLKSQILPIVGGCIQNIKLLITSKLKFDHL
jgi:hypothetical protein